MNVTRSSMPPFEEYCREIQELWDSRWLTNHGSKHQQFQADLSAYLGHDNVSLFVNGHLALETALEALDLPAGGQVITTPFTFASTTHAIVRKGLEPVFCDIEETFYTMDPARLEGLITPKTVAIMPVHVYGNLCQVEAIEAIAKRHNLKVIYDAAHAFGIRYQGQSVAAFGDIAMFSFHATKVFHSIEGGCLCYQDSTLTERLQQLRNFGIYAHGDCLYPGGNSKMNEFQAAMGICNLRYLDGEIQKRGAAVARYRQRLGGVEGIRLCPVQEGVTPNYSYFPVVFEGYRLNRDQVFQRLKEQDICARKYFHPLTSNMVCYQNLPSACQAELPVAKRIVEQILTLPLFADLTLEDVDRICDIILK
ncbi:MAG: DegT/DnrJ/EryC1/StrS family aminotransferase [Oscillospiraceae bacterium]|nr:DegT/DnrJ/EryC1/StrS family aminotransferase [Oscillospiraceae bacterium]